ncbi:MAG: tRNA-intron lyase [Desulfurococcaceae archaeon]
MVVFYYYFSNQIYWNGYYGTFLGISKPRDKNIRAPLELSLIEASYLVEKGVIDVIKNGKTLEYKELISISEKNIDKFNPLYAVYSDLKTRGFVIRRGLKFGCDYLIYRVGPGVDHAPFGVLVYGSRESIDPIELVRAGRLLHSVRKKLVVAVISGEGEIKYLIFNWWKP